MTLDTTPTPAGLDASDASVGVTLPMAAGLGARVKPVAGWFPAAGCGEGVAIRRPHTQAPIAA